MKALLLTLKLETPLLITGVGNGEENSSRSLPYIPGAVIRGALVARYKSAANDLLVDKLAKKLFFSGQVRFLNAYPIDQIGERVLPVPASWRISKGADLKATDVTDFAVGKDDKKDVTLKKPYWGTSAKKEFYAFEPEDELAIHISQERGVVRKDRSRPEDKDDQGGGSTVFQYQSLARGQRFCAVIVADQNETGTDILGEIEKLLTPDVCYLGRSRSAEYGKVLIEYFEQKDWQETTPSSQALTTITLLSDAILRDRKSGQPSHDLDGYLSRRLHKKEIKHSAAFINPVVVGGFNRKWQSPLPQMPALGMGSVFVYSADQLTANELAVLAESGIGERCVDGFGRIAVNWPAQPTLKLSEAKPVKPSDQISLSPESQKLALTMSERLLRHTLELNLIAEVKHYSIMGNITNHQLARLRIILRQALDSQDKSLAGIETFFGNLKKTAVDQWHKTRLRRDGDDGSSDDIRLRLWLDERCRELDGLSKLKISDDTNVPEVAGQRAPLTEQIKKEYTLRLMEAVIDQAMKQDRQGGI